MGASFYGNVGVGSGSSNPGTDNYNDLSNKPIINISAVGTTNLSSLAQGLYKISGDYIYSQDDTEVKHLASATLVQVYLDATTGDKIITFDTYENSKHITYNIDYLAEGTYKVDKYTYEVIKSISGTTEDLPEKGDSSQIYSTDEGLFVWNDDKQDYVKLGTGEATEQTWDDM